MAVAGAAASSPESDKVSVYLGLAGLSSLRLSVMSPSAGRDYNRARCRYKVGSRAVKVLVIIKIDVGGLLGAV